MADRHIIGKTPAEIADLSNRGLLAQYIAAPDDWTPPTDTQFTREDLKSMTPEQIAEADRLGQFANLYTQEHTK
ncbi:hypothetical protein AB0O38_16075 [Pseudarthrobacter oxydans]|uniref:hypothetical protein n=1 Tax=Pseudarthrobacter oxydans TaxID=1671 RepID=UPI003429F9DA